MELMTVPEMEESNAWGLLSVGVNSSQMVGLLIYWGTISTLDIDLGSIPADKTYTYQFTLQWSVK